MDYTSITLDNYIDRLYGPFVIGGTDIKDVVQDMGYLYVINVYKLIALSGVDHICQSKLILLLSCYLSLTDEWTHDPDMISLIELMDEFMGNIKSSSVYEDENIIKPLIHYINIVKNKKIDTE